MNVERVYSSAPWESIVGYCRAVKAGAHVYVTGSAPVETDGSITEGGAYAQARRCIEVIVAALQEFGLGPEHVVRTRMFVTDISQWETFGKAHREVFAEHPPATTMVEVQRLIAPSMLIEIEADAVAME